MVKLSSPLASRDGGSNGRGYLGEFFGGLRLVCSIFEAFNRDGRFEKFFASIAPCR